MQNTIDMKKLIILLLTAIGALTASAETWIPFIDSTPKERPENPRVPQRVPGVVPSVWYDCDAIGVETSLPWQTVTIEIADADGIVTVQTASTGSGRSARFDASMLAPGEDYTITITIGSRQWSGTFTAD